MRKELFGAYRGNTQRYLLVSAYVRGETSEAKQSATPALRA